MLQFKIHTANHPHTRKQIDKKKSWDNKNNFLMLGGHSVAWPRFYEQIRLTFNCTCTFFCSFFFSFFLSVLTGEMTLRFPPGLLGRKREGLNWCNWQKSIKEKKLEVSAKDNGGNVFALSVLWVKSLTFNNIYFSWLFKVFFVAKW